MFLTHIFIKVIKMIKRTRQKMVVFDLDGTLIDTAPDLISSAREVISEIIDIEIDPETSRKFIGKGGEYFIKKNLEFNNISLEQSKIEKLIYEFLNIYEKNISNQSSLYPNAIKTLNWLKDNDYVLNICTNKPEKLAKIILEDFNVISYFDEIIGGDTLAQNKPNPLPLLTIMKNHNIKPLNTLMVGDTTTDILTAKNCNVRSVCVDFGYFDEKIPGVEADFSISDLFQIKEILLQNY